MDNGSEGGAHFLTVNYMDQGYEYRGLYDDDLPWADADQETLKKALEKYPLEIPVNAEFLQEGEGWHCFTAQFSVFLGYSFQIDVNIFFGKLKILFR
jgi:hypothetical protein